MSEQHHLVCSGARVCVVSGRGAARR